VLYPSITRVAASLHYCNSTCQGVVVPDSPCFASACYTVLKGQNPHFLQETSTTPWSSTALIPLSLPYLLSSLLLVIIMYRVHRCAGFVVSQRERRKLKSGSAITCVRNTIASSRVKRKAGASISVSCPWARRRASYLGSGSSLSNGYVYVPRCDVHHRDNVPALYKEHGHL